MSLDYPDSSPLLNLSSSYGSALMTRPPNHLPFRALTAFSVSTQTEKKKKKTIIKGHSDDVWGTKRLVSVHMYSVEGNSAGIFVSKESPGIFVIKER